MRLLTHRSARPVRRARRRRPLPAWLASGLRWAGAASAIALLLLGAIWIDRAGWIGAAWDEARHRTLALSATAGFVVQDVTVVGRAETAPDDLLAALDVRRGMPLLAFEPQEARVRIERLPWVRSVRVERAFPDAVRVVLVERRPIAMWQDKGRLHVIDAEGAVIRVRDIRRFRHLPIVVGADAPAHAGELLDMVAADERLGPRLTAAIRVSGRRWNLRFDDRIEIRLPAEDMASAWVRLAALERRQGLLQRDIIAVDLRLPDRLVVQVAPGAAPRRAAQKST